MFENKETHLLIPVILALLLNYIINVRKWDEKYKRKRGLLPSGPVIGIIWIFLLLCLGNAHFILYKHSGYSMASIFLILVMIYCVSYPIVTQLNQKKGRVLNTVALIITSILLLLVHNESVQAFYYVVPLFIWTSFVNYSDAIVCSNFVPK
jgi:tryptophan-rich sensory protein